MKTPLLALALAAILPAQAPEFDETVEHLQTFDDPDDRPALVNDGGAQAPAYAVGQLPTRDTESGYVLWSSLNDLDATVAFDFDVWQPGGTLGVRFFAETFTRNALNRLRVVVREPATSTPIVTFDIPTAMPSRVVVREHEGVGEFGEPGIVRVQVIGAAVVRGHRRLPVLPPAGPSWHRRHLLPVGRRRRGIARHRPRIARRPRRRVRVRVARAAVVRVGHRRGRQHVAARPGVVVPCGRAGDGGAARDAVDVHASTPTASRRPSRRRRRPDRTRPWSRSG